MGQQIILSGEKKRQLQKDFKVCRTTLWAALNYKTKEGKANLLRAAALQRGGVLLNQNGDFEPNLKFDTYWTEVPHQMVQVFSGRVRLIADIKSSTVTIEKDGAVVRTFENATISELPVQQAYAQEIVNNLK